MSVSTEPRAEDQSLQAIAASYAATEQIVENLGIDSLIRSLVEIPETIRRQQEEVAARQTAVEQLEGEAVLQESILSAAVSEEIDPRTSKKLYSNAEARQAELIRRKAETTDYQAAQAKLREAKEILQSARFDLERLTNEFAALRRVADLMAARLSLIGH